ncbi:MarC family protein [Pseudomonas denitrificans (nom. rej.)]|uniref:MarC family protein n=1 Tax=Pseudomonas denitrificans TaxID=43306 RepID=UPI00256FF620|nr:MarC family protein [Pseudomonas denitrificans (nom. rej.)]
MSSLFDAILLGLLALLPLINPPTTVALFLALSQGFSREEKNQQALLTACYVFIIMTLTYYIGEFIMGVFSISIPGLRVAGAASSVSSADACCFPRPCPPLTPARTCPNAPVSPSSRWPCPAPPGPAPSR